MPIDSKLLQQIFTLENIECCAEGMQLSEVFLVSCAAALETLNRGHPEMGKTTFLTHWQALVEHRAACPSCQDVR